MGIFTNNKKYITNNPSDTVTALFGINIDKSYFGKKPNEGSISRDLLFSPAYRRGQLDNEIEKVNSYGEGSFEPYDVIPLFDSIGESTLSINLLIYEFKDCDSLELGQKIKTDLGTSVIFGYQLPEDWETIGIKVIDENQKKYKFAIVKKEKIQKHIRLRPLGIIID